MIKYEVKPVVCDYGIYENEELKLILNDRQNALEIKKILEMDQCNLRYTKWQDDVFNSAYDISKKLIEDNDLQEIEEVITMQDLIIKNVSEVKEILNYYGEETQALKAIEELAELQSAIVRQNLEDIEEKLADSIIMELQLLYFMGIRTEEVFKKIKYKINSKLKEINAVG